ncbi:MAG: ferritin-like domain-containing protein, partial [Cyanobacteria bacterium J06576_12]
DMVAERVTALAGTAMGTVRIAASNSILPEYDFDAVGGMEHVAALADRYAAYAKHLREGIANADEQGDMDTSDLYTETLVDSARDLWFLEAHLVG